MHIRSIAVAAAMSVAMPGCVGARQKGPDLGELYDTAAQNIGAERNPVVVIPGVLGSKLEDFDTKTEVWGAFVYGAADADTPEGARLVALPMAQGEPLADLRDRVEATEALDTLELDFGFLRGLEIGAYVDILLILAAGDYVDRDLAESGAVNYGTDHYTCFQFAYDWRRDLSEQAARLHSLILGAEAATQAARGNDDPVKVDVVAHSMGGLVLRYYLRYGPQPLPEDSSLPELTWEGAERIEHAIIVGTPNAGSALALSQLVNGVRYAPLTPYYRSAVLGTMPAIYMLLPRDRHGAVVIDGSGERVDILDAATWERFGWGLADPRQDKALRWLLPEAESAEERRAIALDHLRKTLARTDQFFRAVDAPAEPPDDLQLILIAGDAERTPSRIAVNRRTGDVRISERAPGDGTVTRDSALLDERIGAAWRPRLQSPIGWSHVLFLHSDHLGLTRDPAFSDYVLFTLLESPRGVAGPSPTAP